MLRREIEKLIKDIVKQKVDLERPATTEHGDFSTNIALKAKINPDEIISKLKDNALFEKVEKAGPGFINFYLSKKALQEELNEILKQDNDYGKSDIGQAKKIQVEFISANPTGPLTVGNARGGPFGDVLANVFKKAGFKVEKAYYVNDFGEQIRELGKSIIGEGKYQGEYINKLKKALRQAQGKKNVFKAGQWAAKNILENLIQKTIDKLGIKYDEWLFESDLHKSDKVNKVLNILREKGLIYKQDEAEWFKSKQFGDERDRVIIKKDGNKTYLAGDIALHNDKFKDKKFDKVINIWGADHHGDVPGLMAGVEALGYKDKLEIILLQFVTILDKGEKYKMSKRAGLYVLMDELLDKVGKDAVRFFFLQKSPDTHLNFDLELAKEQSSKNPVYYVQYAYARIHSILAKTENKESKLLFENLNKKEEINLIKQLIKFPEIVEDVAKDYQVQRLPYYSIELANAFHRFYENCKVLDKNEKIAQARISLIKATKIVLKNTLELMGISAPDKM
ncbi:arginine--tRNA ligase [Patescibacteria group bacterium]|nr:arginine--tRNA ligase [Patescibacteria group bacterium]